MLNEEIVKAGYANLMTIPPNVKHQEAFLTAYREARKTNVAYGEIKFVFSAKKGLNRQQEFTALWPV